MSFFLPKCKQKIQGFLPYQTNENRSTFFGEYRQFFWLRSLFGRAEILVILVRILGEATDYGHPMKAKIKDI